jgi:hypothetical protein
LVRPDGLLAAAPLVLRFAPDRRRLSGDVQPGAAPGCRTGFLSVGGSNYRQQIFRPNDRFSVYKNLVRPDGLLRGLRPLGLAHARLALRAINFATGEVVEPTFCLSAVRMVTNQQLESIIAVKNLINLVRHK